MATGRTIEAIREDVVRCLNGIGNLTIEVERGLDANKVVFLDRGYPDALAFCRVYGLNPNEFLANCFHHRYASVFLPGRFPSVEPPEGFHKKQIRLAQTFGTVLTTCPLDQSKPLPETGERLLIFCYTKISKS